MQVIELKTISKFVLDEPTFVALGTFDGCHMAHKRVLTSAFYGAKKQRVKSLAYIFDTVPKSYINGEIKVVYTLEERIKAIKALGIDYLCIDSFERVKDLSPSEFFENVLKGELFAVGASCGYNYKFGKNAQGTPELLKELFSKNGGGSVDICEEITSGERLVSSTLLRELIVGGEVEDLFSLGSCYSIYSRVEFGKQLATKMGLPTINQKIPEGKIVPKTGVYITECEIGEDVYPSITNVGVRPTTDRNGEINVETHIVGYSGYLYGSYIRVNFYKYLRPEKKFESNEELFLQIERDKKSAVEYFK
ncbi:MAG: hypothetical protein J6A90_03295 [Clostridia bacterium]|nr:hypothetical protein [Clostridia bacterium]